MICVWSTTTTYCNESTTSNGSRNPDLAQESKLPTAKKVVDEKKVTGVQYGNQKRDSAAEGKAVGTDALRIKLNTGQQTASANTGGVNV